MREARAEQRLEGVSPCVAHRVETESLAHVLLAETEKRLRHVTGTCGRRRGQVLTLEDLELEPGVELAEVMEERKDAEPRLRYVVHAVLP